MVIVVFDPTDKNIIRCVLKTTHSDQMAAFAASDFVEELLAARPELADEPDDLVAAVSAEHRVELVAWVAVELDA